MPITLWIAAALFLFTSASQPQRVRRVEIVAKRYEFAPSQITLKQGEPVLLALRSEDVAHSLVVKELKLAADIHKDRVTELRVTPQSPGTFIGKCGRFCGSGHGRMLLSIHVTE